MSGEVTHWGASPTHGGLTQHSGPAETCSAPDCLDANFPPRDEHGRFLPYARRKVPNRGE